MRTKEQEQLIVDLRAFIASLVFEDAGTALDKTYRFLRGKKEIEGFGIDVDMRGKPTVNMIVRFSHDDSLSFTVFEGK